MPQPSDRARGPHEDLKALRAQTSPSLYGDSAKAGARKLRTNPPAAPEHRSRGQARLAQETGGAATRPPGRLSSAPAPARRCRARAIGRLRPRNTQTLRLTPRTLAAK